MKHPQLVFTKYNGMIVRMSHLTFEKFLNINR
jgi:hypothetical protein